MKIEEREDFVCVDGYRSLYYTKRGSLFNFPEKIKKILLFRTARMWAVQDLIHIINSIFPTAYLAVLAQPSVKENLLSNPLVNRVIEYGDRFFNIFKDLKLIRLLRKEQFDVVCIPYNNPSGKGYFHVNTASFLIKPKYIVVYDVTTFKLCSFNRNYFALKTFLTSLSKPFKLLIEITLVVGIIIIAIPILTGVFLYIRAKDFYKDMLKRRSKQ